MENFFPHLRHERGSSEAGHHDHVPESPKIFHWLRFLGLPNRSPLTPTGSRFCSLMIVDLTTTASMCPLCAEIAARQTSHRLLRLPSVVAGLCACARGLRARVIAYGGHVYGFVVSDVEGRGWFSAFWCESRTFAHVAAAWRDDPCLSPDACLRSVSYPTVINRWMSTPVHLVFLFPSCGPRGSCPWFGW